MKRGSKAFRAEDQTQEAPAQDQEAPQEAPAAEQGPSAQPSTGRRPGEAFQ